MIDEHQDVSPLILNQIMKKLENIRSKIEFDLVETGVVKNFLEPDDMQQEISPVTLITILKTVEGIEGILHKKVAYLSVEEAVASFSTALKKTKKPRGYRYALERFMQTFQGRNLLDITPNEVEAFMSDTWPGGKNNALRTRHAQLCGLFEHALYMLKCDNKPLFNNPMQLIKMLEPVRLQIDVASAEHVARIVMSPPHAHYRMIMGILATTGMRPDELLKLRVKDKEGQVLTLWHPKSGNEREWAVVPKIVKRMMDEHIALYRLSGEDKICTVSYSTILKDIVLKYSTLAGTPFSPKYFRKWVANYWVEKGDKGMVKFVLRYSFKKNEDHFDPLIKKMYEDQYGPPCSVEEACEKIRQLEIDLLSE